MLLDCFRVPVKMCVQFQIVEANMKFYVFNIAFFAIITYNKSRNMDFLGKE